MANDGLMTYGGLAAAPEEEEERRRRRLASDAAVERAIAQMASYQPAQPSSADAELASRWRQQENVQLDKLRKGSEYGLGELARDLGPGILAAIVDGTQNKGRGVANIAAATLQNAQANAERDDARQAQLYEQALATRAARQRSAMAGGQDSGFDRAYKQLAALSERDRIELARQSTGLRAESAQQGERRTKLAEDQAAYLRDPEDPRARALQADLYAVTKDPTVFSLPISTLRERGMITKEQVAHAFAPVKAQDAAAAESEKIKARVQTEADTAGTAAQTAATKAAAASGASTAARIGAESDLAEVSAETAGKEAVGRVRGQRAAEIENRAAPYGFDIDDKQIFDGVSGDPQLRRQRHAMGASALQLKELSSEVRDLRAKYGTSVLPSRERSRAETLKRLMLGQLNAMAGAGVMNPSEAVVWDRVVPGLEGSWKDILGRLTGTDLSLEQLTGLTDAVDDAVRATAPAYGIKWRGLDSAPAGAEDESDGAPDWGKYGL